MNSARQVPASEAINAALPLRVDEVAITDPVLTLSGDRWSLVLWCPYHVTDLDFGWESDDLEDRVWDLVGYRIQRFSTTPRGPIFGFGGGVDLELDEGDETDPWVLTIPGRIITGGTRSPYWS